VKIFPAFITLGCILVSTLFSLEDLGTYGPLYDIKERNLKVAIKEELTKKMPEIEEYAKTIFESGMIYNIDIPFSQKKETLVKKFALSLPDKNGVEQIHDGQSTPFVINDSLCIVNFEAFNILDDIVEHFGKKCRYVFLNIDIRKISKVEKYKELEKFIGNDMLFNMMEISSTPVKITLNNDVMKYEYLNYNNVKNRTKQKLLLENSDKD